MTQDDANILRTITVNDADGFASALREYWSTAYDTGYRDGLYDGRDEGYDDGYQSGLDDGREQCDD